MTEARLLKPRIRRIPVGWGGGGTGWHLMVPDQGDAHSTIEHFDTFEEAVEGLAEWWRRGNWASFLRHPGYGHDRRREAAEFIATQRGA